MEQHELTTITVGSLRRQHSISFRTQPRQGQPSTCHPLEEIALNSITTICLSARRCCQPLYISDAISWQADLRDNFQDSRSVSRYGCQCRSVQLAGIGSFVDIAVHVELAYQNLVWDVWVFWLVASGLAFLASLGFERENVRRVEQKRTGVEDSGVQSIDLA